MLLFLPAFNVVFGRCIDGYSRKIMWLKASYTNHRPGLIASYFVECCQQFGGYPAHVRTDCGTENVTVAAIQASVTGSATGHIYGTSPGNQRIEAWWSFLRRNRSQWWIDYFEHLVGFGVFHPGSAKEIECIRYCFGSALQKDLDIVRQQWNTHRIRPSAGACCPAGVPDELFYLPQLPAVNCMVRDAMQLPQEVIDELKDQHLCEHAGYEEYFDYLCDFHGWASRPTDAESAAELYFRLAPLLLSDYRL